MASLERERLVAESERVREPLLSPDLAATPQIPAAASTLPGSPPPAPAPAPAQRAMPAPGAGMLAAQQEQKKSRAPLVAAIVLLGGGALAVGGWQLYERVLAKPDAASPIASKTVAPPATADAAAVASATPEAPTTDAATVASATPDASATLDAATAVAAVADAAAAPADAAEVAAVIDAAVAPVDAAQVAATVDAAPTPSNGGGGDALSITSTPRGARVYLDGADAGVTPLALPTSVDKHTIALLLPGHELYIAQVDGAGKFQIPLTEVPRFRGPAGIKVIRCKDKHRYYVFVDGKPTGMMCPTERIDVDTGPHIVEIYDAVTESRRKWDIDIKDTRLSFRVKVE